MSVKIHPKIVVDTGNVNEKNTKIKNDKSNENSHCSNNASNSASLYFSTQHKQFRKSMAQDAEDGPDFLDVEQHGWDLNSPFYNNNTSRPPMNQEEFDKRFCYRTPRSSNILKERASALLRYYYRPCLSSRSMTNFFLNLFPILQWLPNYEWKNWFASDIVGGIVTGVMHVPQGIAYAQLAGVDAVVGLYTSFFPPLIYMFFGTSRHNSIGSFAVVALMSNVAMNRLFDAREELSNNFNNASDSNPSPLSPIIVSSTLACCIGLVTLAMGILRLDMISTYFSDQVVAGFTTGASVHVFAAQLKFIFGLSGLPARSGAGNLIMKFYDICKRIPQIHIPTFTVSVISIILLCIGKEFLNPLLKKNFKLNVPIPFELFLMVLGTFLSFLFHGHSKYGLEIVDHIPAGIPTPIMPDLTLLPELLPDAVAIAAVVMAVHISLAKIIAKKKCYRVDPGQELFALGFSSTLSSFFPVYPVSCSLAFHNFFLYFFGCRNSLLWSMASDIAYGILKFIFVSTFHFQCILSSIIIVALKGIFRKIADLRRLWPLSRIDFSIWLVSFVSTVCWDVSQGLVISIGFALLTTVFRTQWPRWHFLANLSGTNDFRDAERYELIHTFPGICIFRFDSPLLFTNVDNFKETIHKAFQRWKRYQGAQLGLHVVGSTLRLRQTTSTPSLQIFTKLGSNGIVVPANLSPQSNLQRKRDDDEYKQNEKKPEDEDTEAKTEALSQDFNNQKTLEKIGSFDSPQHLHFIVDCSGFTFVDCMGVNALKEIFTEMRQQRVRVYFAAAKAPVRDLFEKCGFYEYVPKRNFYPTIRDAVAIARMRRNASSQNLLDESVIHRVYDEIETMQITQPEQ
uniref:STAS domain-containing protein n=1 Tax=Meloidogyne enterolobii TaxID=390850 RepID=A0A6V7V522_MELEN|nr:unnamed protein product [Meloidogyne enterolobii]